MEKDVDIFLDSCLHFLSSHSSSIVPRSLAHAVHGRKPKEVIHFVYCHMGPRTGSEQYVFIIKDELKSYFWLIPCSNTYAITKVDSLLRWFASFGTAKT